MNDLTKLINKRYHVAQYGVCIIKFYLEPKVNKHTFLWDVDTLWRFMTYENKIKIIRDYYE